MDLDTIKKLTLRALMSDETLMHSLVLKGGNALQLVYEITNRGSIDIDFSVKKEFTEREFEKMPILLDYILNQTFRNEGLVVFDVNFIKKPKTGTIPEWRGYLLDFKVIESEKYDKLEKNIDEVRKRAIKVNDQSPRYVVDISAYEYVDSATTKEIDGIILRVYTLEMILFEKFRALCQTMSEYKNIVHSARPKHRARDVYDICIIYDAGNLELDKRLLYDIFAAKRVPLEFLNHIETLREHNRENWETVKSSIDEVNRTALKDYDYYFDKILEIIKPFRVL